MDIGYLQCDIKFGDKNYNLKHIETTLSRLPHLDLLVLPEMCNVGYAFDSKDELMEVAEESGSGETIEFFRKHAKQMDTLLIAGFAERNGNKLFNSTAAVFPDGDVKIYRKSHLFWNEKTLFEPGDTGLTVFDFRGVKLSIIICFDWCFPEVWRTLGLRGVQLVCMPSNLVLPEKAQKAVPVMCMMNKYFAICCNRIGTEKDLTFTGGSLIADPEGKVLCNSPPDREDFRYTTIVPSLALNKWMTPTNHVFNDRRTEFYEL